VVTESNDAKSADAEAGNTKGAGADLGADGRGVNAGHAGNAGGTSKTKAKKEIENILTFASKPLPKRTVGVPAHENNRRYSVNSHSMRKCPAEQAMWAGPTPPSANVPPTVILYLRATSDRQLVFQRGEIALHGFVNAY
jgi:hypothetical protein